MRVIVSGSGIFMMCVLLILIHTSILNRSIREAEVNCGLENAVDYALDIASEFYREYRGQNEEEYITDLLNVFCHAVNNAVGTDGQITVSLAAADIEYGTFDFIVEEQYSYMFCRKNAVCVCERTVTFGD